MRTKKLTTLLIVAFTFALSFTVIAQSKKEAVDAYNSGATLMKENPEAALEQLYLSLKLSDELGEDGEETKVLAESLIPTTHWEYAMKLYKDKKMYETLEQLEKAEETAVKFGDTKTQQRVEKTIPKLYYAMGVTNYKEDKFEKAIEYYNKALNFNPEYPDPVLGIALSYEKQEDYEKMLEYLKKTIEVANAANDREKSEDALKKAKAYLLRNGDEAQKANKNKDAVEWFGRVLEFDANDGSVYYVLAINYNSLKDWDNAIANANIAIEKGNGSLDIPGLYYQLGLAYQGKGSNDDACEAFSKALSGTYKTAAEYQMKEVLKCN